MKIKIKPREDAELLNLKKYMSEILEKRIDKKYTIKDFDALSHSLQILLDQSGNTKSEFDKL